MTAVRKNLHHSLVDASSFGTMVGIGETYVPAFVLAVGLGEVTAGLVASLPMFAGGVMQMVSPFAVRKLGSHRRWVVCCAAMQALSFLPLIYAAVLGSIPALGVFAVATVYWGSGMATGPAWNTWIETLIPRQVRPRFFALRTRLQQMCVLTGFLLGGLILRIGTERGTPLMAFALLFVIAASCRSLSALFLFRQSEHGDRGPLVAGNTRPQISGDSTATVRGAEAGVPAPVPTERFSLESLIRPFREGSGGRLLAYMVAVQAAVQISGPYFTPYMLRKLEMSYTDFVILIAVSFLAKVLSLQIWGRFAQRFGAHRLLWLGSLGIIPVAGLWIISSTFPWLIFVQAAGGVMWAAWELAVLLLFFESIPRAQRTHVLTVFNLANATAWILGAMLGAAVLQGFGPAKETYYLLFVLSSLFRLSAILLLKRIPEIRVMKGFIPTRTVAIRPTSGTVDKPILAEDEPPVAEVAPLAAAATRTEAKTSWVPTSKEGVVAASNSVSSLHRDRGAVLKESDGPTEAARAADMNRVNSSPSPQRSLIACHTSSLD